MKIKMEDKFLNLILHEEFIKILNLPPKIVTNESEDEIMMSLINISFIELMNIYLQQHYCTISPGKIIMQLFYLTVAYEFDFLKLLT
jgi:hypothetical protein